MPSFPRAENSPDFSGFGIVRAVQKAIESIDFGPKLTAEQQSKGAGALTSSFGSLEDLKAAIELNADELKKIAGSNQDAAKLLEILGQDFDMLHDINERIEHGERVRGSEIRELNETFDMVSSTLTNMNERGKISELKTLTGFDLINETMGKYLTQQQETNDILNEQLFEDKSLREMLEESGLGEAGLGLLDFFGLAALAIPIKKFINAWKFLKSIKMADIALKVGKFLKPFKFVAEVLFNFVKGPAKLFTKGIQLLGKVGKFFAGFKIIQKILSPFEKGISFVQKIFGKVSKAFTMIGKIFAPVVTVFKKVASVFKPVTEFFSKFAKAMQPALKFGKVAVKFTKGIPIIGQIITAFLAIFDFASGFGNAAKIAGKAQEAVTLGDKIQAGIASVLSGLTFGFVSAEKFFEIIDNVKNFFTETLPNQFSMLWDKVKAFFSPEGFGSKIVDALVAPFKLATDIFMGIGKSIWDAVSKTFKGIFSADSITDALAAAFGGITSLWSGIGEAIYNAISEALKAISFGALDLGELKLPGFEELVAGAKEILNVMKIPFEAIDEAFGNLVGKAESLKDSFAEGITTGLSSLGSFLGFGDDEEEKPDNVIDINQKRASMGNRGIDQVKKDQERNAKAQQETIKRSKQPINVSVNAPSGGGNSAPNRDIESPESKDTRLAIANRGFGD